VYFCLDKIHSFPSHSAGGDGSIGFQKRMAEFGLGLNEAPLENSDGRVSHRFHYWKIGEETSI